MSSLKRLLPGAALLLFFLCCLFIAWNVPYTHDDWDWGLEKSWELWRSGAMNSRYMGTLFVLTMTRSPLFKTLVMGGTLFLLPVLSGRLAAGEQRDHRFFLVLLAGAALFATPMISWRQVFGWVSAFSNFVLGGLFLLLVLLLWKRAFSPRPGRSLLLSLALFPVCLAAQLFAENITAVLLAASFVVAGYALVTRRARLPALVSLAACCLGAWLMFHNALYTDLVSSGEALNGIRRLSFSPDDSPLVIVQTVLSRYFTSYQVLPGVLEGFPAVTALLGAGCVWRLANRRGAAWKAAAVAAGLWTGAYSLFCTWMMYHLIWDPLWVHPWPLLRSAAPVFHLLLAVVVIAGERPGSRAPRQLLILAAAGMQLPFGILLEGGPRCAFPSVLCLLLCGLSLLEDFPWPRWSRLLTVLALGAAVGFHVWAYALIGQNEAVRQEQMRLARRGEITQAVFPTEPLSYYYFWGRNPGAPERVASFRQFYDLPEDVELVFLPMGSDHLWPDIPEDVWEQALRF